MIPWAWQQHCSRWGSVEQNNAQALLMTTNWKPLGVWGCARIILESKLGISPNESVPAEANATIVVSKPRSCFLYDHDPGHWIYLMSSDSTVNKLWKVHFFMIQCGGKGYALTGPQGLQIQKWMCLHQPTRDPPPLPMTIMQYRKWEPCKGERNWTFL